MLIYAIPSFIFFIVNIAIIFLLLRLIEYNELSITMIGLVAIFGTLNLMNGLVISAPSEHLAFIFGSLHGILALAGVGFVLYFVFIFPERAFPGKNRHLVRTLCFLPSIIFILAFFTGTYINGVENTDYGYRELFGIEFEIFSFFLAATTIGIIIYLIMRYRKTSGITKKKILPVLLGIIAILATSEVTFAVLGSGMSGKMLYPPVGVWAGTIWGVVIYYSVRRYSILKFTPGRTYVLWDGDHEKVLKKLNHLMDTGYRCKLITKHNPKFIKNRHPNLDITWLSEKESENAVYPSLEYVIKDYDVFVNKYTQDSIVILDAFDYLATPEDESFKSALTMLRRLIDANATTSNVLIVPISSETFDARRKSQILRSGVEVIKEL